MVSVGHPTGNQFFRHLVRALKTRGVLAQAYTCLDFSTWTPLLETLPSALRGELSRRCMSKDLGITFRTRPLRELGRLLGNRTGLQWLTRHEIGACSADSVFQDFDRWLARQLEPCAAKGIYCYEDSALATFTEARNLGITRFYDLPIAYWARSRKILEEEAERLPQWADTLVGPADSQSKLDRKMREFELADVVICPSHFVSDSIPVSIRESKPVHVIPFGSPMVHSALAHERETFGPPNAAHSPLKILFAGSMTQRKGLADVFAAMRMLNSGTFELHVMGTPVVEMRFYRAQFPKFVYHPTRPHSEVLQLMRSCDVLVLPSIVEGRALVQQEAMACGLPIVVTRNAGGEDLIKEGETGFLVPIRSPEKIAEKLEWFVDNRALMPHMRECARAKAASLTWEAYGNHIVDVIQGAMAGFSC